MALTLGFSEDISWDEFTQVVYKATEQLTCESQYIKGFDDISFRLRNAMSRLFDLDLTIEPGVNDMVKCSTYLVLELDLNYHDHGEITILDLAIGIPVVVDLDREVKEKILALNIKKGNEIKAKISSEISSLGQTGVWRFIELMNV